MAIPTLATDYTSIYTFEGTTNVSGWGNNTGKWGNSPDVELEGTYCYAMQPNQTGDSGMGVTGLGGINLSTNRLFLWVWIIGRDFVNTIASKGIYVRVCTSAASWTAEYNDYIVGGSDVAWCGSGWHLIALDCTRTADASLGTTTLTNIDRVGVGFNVNTTANKSDVIAIDQWWYGTYVEATGVTSSSSTHNFNDNGASADTITRGSGDFTTDGFEAGNVIRVTGTTGNDGEYTVVTAAALTLTLATGVLNGTETSVTSFVDAGITLESIYQKDGPTDDNWYGIVSRDRNGNFEINGKLIIGDQSGTARTFFVSRGDPIIIADQMLNETTSEHGIFAAEDTSAVTKIVFGDSSGTGDDRVGFGGSTVRQVTDFADTTTDGAGLGTLDLSVAIDTMELFGTTFQNVTGGVALANDTSHLATNCAFSACGQADLYAAEARNLEFSNYTGAASTGALLWRYGTTDIENSRFLANTRAVEHTTAGSVNYVGMRHAGNTYDVDFSGTGALIINNDADSNASTSTISGSGTSVTFVSTKDVDVHVEDSDGNAIQYAVVQVRRATPTSYTSDTGNNAGDADFVVNEVVDTDQAQTGWIRVWRKSDNAVVSFRYASWTSKTFTLMTEVTGTVTTAGGVGQEGTQLTDSAADFGVTEDVVQGDAIRNTTDGSWALVDQVVSTTELKTSPLRDGAGNKEWDLSDAYSIHRLPTTFIDNDDIVDIPLYMEETDASGDITTYAHNYSAGAMAIKVRIRYNEGATKYVPYATSGIIGANGYSLNAVLQEDEVAS